MPPEKLLPCENNKEKHKNAKYTPLVFKTKLQCCAMSSELHELYILPFTTWDIPCATVRPYRPTNAQ